jgi:hypothetical protein
MMSVQGHFRFAHDLPEEKDSYPFMPIHAEQARMNELAISS